VGHTPNGEDVLDLNLRALQHPASEDAMEVWLLRLHLLLRTLQVGVLEAEVIHLAGDRLRERVPHLFHQVGRVCGTWWLHLASIWVEMLLGSDFLDDEGLLGEPAAQAVLRFSIVKVDKLFVIRHTRRSEGLLAVDEVGLAVKQLEILRVFLKLAEGLTHLWLVSRLR